MKITAITAQQKDKNRVNVIVDGSYRFSLDVFQYADLGIKVGQDYSEDELCALETESQFGKAYTKALEYCLMRPHSAKEMRDYLYKKTRDVRSWSGDIKKGLPTTITDRVFNRLSEKGYINDESFTRYWVENRRLSKGASRRTLQAELRAKGVESRLIDQFLDASTRTDENELQKVITKKRSRYPDEKKLTQYLIRQGFDYDDVKQALTQEIE